MRLGSRISLRRLAHQHLIRKAQSVDPDFAARLAAIEHVNALSNQYGDVVPRDRLAEGLQTPEGRIALFNPQSGIHRPRSFSSPAALTIVTAAPKPGRPAPYDDVLDTEAGTITYSYRVGGPDQADNRALRAAFEMRVPLIYLMGIEPGLYSVAAPVFIVHDDPAAQRVLVQIGLRGADLSPAGPTSDQAVRRYALQERRVRLHQHRFRLNVLRAYQGRCTICTLRERSLVQAAHIIEDSHETGIAEVRNGLALCAIHHLAYDRMVLGISPEGVVHIAERLLREVDGPMLREGLQGFHGASIHVPARRFDRPDPQRLDLRFERFRKAA
jgi:putative restriction endonuclease